MKVRMAAMFGSRKRAKAARAPVPLVSVPLEHGVALDFIRGQYEWRPSRFRHVRKPTAVEQPRSATSYLSAGTALHVIDANGNLVYVPLRVDLPVTVNMTVTSTLPPSKFDLLLEGWHVCDPLKECIPPIIDELTTYPMRISTTVDLPKGFDPEMGAGFSSAVCTAGLAALRDAVASNYTDDEIARWVSRVAGPQSLAVKAGEPPQEGLFAFNYDSEGTVIERMGPSPRMYVLLVCPKYSRAVEDFRVYQPSRSILDDYKYAFDKLKKYALAADASIEAGALERADSGEAVDSGESAAAEGEASDKPYWDVTPELAEYSEWVADMASSMLEVFKAGLDNTPFEHPKLSDLEKLSKEIGGGRIVASFAQNNDDPLALAMLFPVDGKGEDGASPEEIERLYDKLFHARVMAEMRAYSEANGNSLDDAIGDVLHGSESVFHEELTSYQCFRLACRDLSFQGWEIFETRTI